jgi:hypothetical protein
MDRGGWHYPHGDFRVSDADRDRAISELSVAFQAGRITADEFDQRSGQAVAARTGKELTGLLADLPVEHAPARRPSGVDPARRVLAARVSVVAGVAAFCCAVAAAGAVLSAAGPTLKQEQFVRALAISHGMPPPPFPANVGVNWAGAITPAAVAVLLVLVIVFLRVRVARAERRP